MSPSILLSLDDPDIDLVTSVVRRWCDANHVDLNSECGRSAMTAAINRVIAGERSPESLNEAITIAMQERYKDPGSRS